MNLVQLGPHANSSSLSAGCIYSQTCAVRVCSSAARSSRRRRTSRRSCISSARCAARARVRAREHYCTRLVACIRSGAQLFLVLVLSACRPRWANTRRSRSRWRACSARTSFSRTATPHTTGVTPSPCEHKCIASNSSCAFTLFACTLQLLPVLQDGGHAEEPDHLLRARDGGGG